MRSVLPETSCLHYLLPDKRDVSVTDRLPPKHFNIRILELLNFEIVLYHIVYIYMIRFSSTATSYVTDF